MFLDHSETCAEYETFLNLLGEKVTLLGFRGYNGGLDVKCRNSQFHCLPNSLHFFAANATGTSSIYTEFKNQEIMFHVSTWLPLSKVDSQQIERKRHIGNDVVVILFLEKGGNLDPRKFVSQFNCIFFQILLNPIFLISSLDAYCIISPIQVPPDSIYGEFPFNYRLSIVTKPGVRICGPQLPDPTIFPPTPQFRNFLLTKLINLERAAMTAPGFASKLERTKGVLLQSLLGSDKKD